MRYTIALLGLVATSSVTAKELRKNITRAEELYDSGFMHEKIMHEKERFWAAEEAKFAQLQALQAFDVAAEDPWPELHVSLNTFAHTLLSFFH